MNNKNFRTYDLSVSFYRMASGLKLKGDARNQLDRASRSIALNLAEGRGKRTMNDSSFAKASEDEQRNALSAVALA